MGLPSRSRAGRVVPWLVVLWMGGGPSAAVGQGVDGLDAPAAGPAEVAGGEQPPAAAYEAEWLAVLPPALQGVDGALAAPLAEQLAATGSALGYRLRGAEVVAAAAQRVGAGRLLSPADQWRITFASGCHASLQARVWAQGGKYVVELTAALRDGRGPFAERRSTDHVAFLETVDAMVRDVLPASGTGAAAYVPPVGPRQPPPGMDPGVFEPNPAQRLADEPAPPLRRIGLAVAADGAIGLGKPGFYNQMAGARLDVRLNHEVVMGAYLGYASLTGVDQRENNLVTYLQIEDRVRVSDRSKVRVPLRFAAGYVPFNGPVLRMAAGIAYPASDRIEWGFDLLAPMIWFLPEGQVVTSLNLGVELIFNP